MEKNLAQSLVAIFGENSEVKIMYFEHISSSDKFQKQTLNPIFLSENHVVITESKTTIPTSNEINSNISVFFLWATVLSIISLVLIKVFHKLQTVKIRSSSILPVSQVPCKSCKFFAKNRYLNCAVHPFTVLTKQAKNCSDYCNKYESYFETDSQS